MDGFAAIEKAMVTLKNEVRSIGVGHHTCLAETDKAFEGLRSYMHDGPELDDADA